MRGARFKANSRRPAGRPVAEDRVKCGRRRVDSSAPASSERRHTPLRGRKLEAHSHSLWRRSRQPEVGRQTPLFSLASLGRKRRVAGWPRATRPARQQSSPFAWPRISSTAVLVLSAARSPGGNIIGPLRRRAHACTPMAPARAARQANGAPSWRAHGRDSASWPETNRDRYLTKGRRRRRHTTLAGRFPGRAAALLAGAHSSAFLGQAIASQSKPAGRPINWPANRGACTARLSRGRQFPLRQAASSSRPLRLRAHQK